jgi:hypothetical protein
VLLKLCHIQKHRLFLRVDLVQMEQMVFQPEIIQEQREVFLVLEALLELCMREVLRATQHLMLFLPTLVTMLAQEKVISR